MEPSERWWVFPGFEVELFATGFERPVNIAFVPGAAPEPSKPLAYVTELYNGVKVVTGDGRVLDYAPGLLDFEPTGQFPGSGESGVTGVCVDPATGDVIVTLGYADGDAMFSKVLRLRSGDGLHAEETVTILDGVPGTRFAHQVQMPSFGFDGKLYVNFADGGDVDAPQDDGDVRGKVLRLNPDGTVPADNPIPGNPMYAKGFRNPFGAAWRVSDGHLYVSMNGPERGDVFARVEPGYNQGWPDEWTERALFYWHQTHVPTALAFCQGGEFPEEFHDHAFLALFGSSWQLGPHPKGKKIVKIVTRGDPPVVRACEEFVVYTGRGPAAPCGLAFGPGGLYFTDLHGERDGEGRLVGSVYRVTRVKRTPRHAHTSNAQLP